MNQENHGSDLFGWNRQAFPEIVKEPKILDIKITELLNEKQRKVD